MGTYCITTRRGFLIIRLADSYCDAKDCQLDSFWLGSR
jgi:hypothetical protein